MNSRLRILHLEDDPNDAFFVQKALEKEGIVADLTTVDNRAAFEAALAADHIDLVLADYRVPRFNGRTALALVRKKYPGKPFIFVTGALGEEFAVETLKTGATDFVLKDHLTRLPLAVRRAMAETREQSRREKAEALLRQNMALLRAITDTSPDPIYLKDRESRILLANRATLAAIGKREEEVVGKSDDVHYADLALARAILETDRRIMTSGKAEVVEEFIPGPDGPRVFLSTKSPFYDANGQLVGLVGVSRDITLRKRAEDALRESEERLRQSLQVGRMFAFDWDFSAGFITRSSHCSEILGLEPGRGTRLTREEFLSQIHPGDCDRLLAVLSQVTVTNPAYQTTYRGFHPNGTLIHLEESGRGQFDAQGRLTRLIGITADVTVREHAKQSLEWELAVNEAVSRLSLPLISSETTIQEVSDAVLDQALKLTDSEHGVVASIQPGSRAIICHTFTRMVGECALAGSNRRVVFECTADGKYPGLWGHALNTGRAFFTNEDPCHHPASTGLPEGHVPIHKLLATPVFLGRELVGLILLANPKRDYTAKDLSAVNRLAGHYALGIQRLRFRQALQAEKDFVQAIVTTAGALVLVVDIEGRIIQFNHACEKTTGHAFQEVAGKVFWDLFIPAEELAQVKSVFASLSAGHYPSYHENHWIARDGRRRRILWSNTVLLNDAKSVQHVIATGLDVTQTREAEGKLRVLTRAIEAGPSSVVITDRSGTITYVNPTFALLTGYSPEEVVGKNPRIWKSGRHTPQFYAALWSRLSQGQEWRGEFCNKRKNGQLFWIYSTISPIKNEAGEISHYVAVIVDITERKSYEQALQQARQDLERKVSERTSDLQSTIQSLQREVQARERAEKEANEALQFERLVAEISTDFTNLTAGRFELMLQEGIRRLMEFLKADRASLTELAADEIRPTVRWSARGVSLVPESIPVNELPWSVAQSRAGKTVYFSSVEDLPPEAAIDRERYRKFGTRSLVALPLVVGRETIGTLVFAAINSSRSWPQQTVNRLRLVGDLFAGLLLRWRSEKALSDAETRFHAVTDFMRDWEYWESPSGAILFCSPACERITGCKPQQFLVEPGLLNQLVLVEDRALWDEFHREALSAPQPRTVQFRIRRSDGEIRWIEHSSQPVFDDHSAFLGLRVSNRDYSAAKESELASQRLRGELARVTRMTMADHLAASLAHELRQPLAAILSNAEAAEQFLAQAPPDVNEAHEALEDIVNNDIRAAHIIQRLRALYRRSGQERNDLDLNALVDETLSLLRSELILRQVSCRQNLNARFPVVSANRVEMQQVLMNLIFNAADAMSANPPEARGLIITSADEEPARVRISLTDSGSGIRPEDVTRLFEPFFTTKDSGMGMGLVISRSIIEAHGGRLWAENNPVRGSTFHFSLPIIPVS